MGAQTTKLALSFDFSERRSRSQFFFGVALALPLALLRAPLGVALVKSGALQYSAFSTINPPLYPGPDSMPCIYKLPPPEFHLLEGIVNHTIDDLDSKMEGDYPVTEFLKGHKIYKVKFQFQGNQCSAILNLTKFTKGLFLKG